MAISDINSGTLTYKVCKGDNLWNIVKECIRKDVPGYESYTTSDSDIRKAINDVMLKRNPDIVNEDLIYVDQKINLTNNGSSKTKNKAQRPTITAFGLQSKTGNSNVISNITYFATWAWDQTKTEEYRVVWKYSTGDGVNWVLSDTTTTYKYSTVNNVPANATSLSFQVKPVSKTYTKNNKEVHYWTADWSTKKTHYTKNNPPKVPPTPTKDDITVDETTAQSWWSQAFEGIKNAVTGNSSSTKLKETIPYDVVIKLTGLQKDIQSGLYLNAHEIQFQILKDDKTVYKTGRAVISKSGDATYKCSLVAGADFKVRCRSYRGAVKGSDNTKYNTSEGAYSDWTEYSPSFGTPPSATQSIDTLYAWKDSNNSTVVRIGWIGDSDPKATYIVGYTDILEKFETNQVESQDVEANYHYTDIYDLEPGKTYYFAVKTVKDTGTSIWSTTRSIIIGEKPGVPTTWSSSSTAKLDDQVTLYWVHNTIDESPEYSARLHLAIKTADSDNAVTLTGDTTTENGTYYINNLKISQNNDDYITINKPKNEQTGLPINSTSSISVTIPSSNDLFKEGVKLIWRVSTAGIYVDSDNQPVYGDFSDYREIDIYSTPTVELKATVPEDPANPYSGFIAVGKYVNEDGTYDETPVGYFPINIAVVSSPNNQTQKPIGYHVSVTADNDYETVDSIGNVKMVKSGEVIFSQHFDITDSTFGFDLTPGNIDLENDQNYTITCEVSMTSGLTAKYSLPFTVQWIEDETWPNLEIVYDGSNYTTILKPYCVDRVYYSDDDFDELIIDGVILSVYRREFDGTFTELATGLKNEDEVYITDPHPALDYARYRVVAVTENTGAVSFYDVPGFPINEKAIIIQWDEEWKELEAITNMDEDGTIVDSESENDTHSWTGSLLRLPYNIDVSDSHNPDVEMVNYIGRENPVAYYGTQIGHTSTWNTEIPADDVDTLYAIRRLARWMGNVYVREPSGTGYWARIKVNYNQKHKVLTIPITFEITRVEGE